MTDADIIAAAHKEIVYLEDQYAARKFEALEDLAERACRERDEAVGHWRDAEAEAKALAGALQRAEAQGWELDLNAKVALAAWRAKAEGRGT